MAPVAQADIQSVGLFSCVLADKSELDLSVQKTDEIPSRIYFSRTYSDKLVPGTEKPEEYHHEVKYYLQDIPLEQAYISHFSNGSEFIVPKGNHWYVFEEVGLADEKDVIEVNAKILSRKTGRLVEHFECESKVKSLIRQIDEEQVTPLPKELSDWFIDHPEISL
ncbi:hypothetical protein [Aggregatibacter kilianii]|uniref:hypothetical protein n=1 Tax=Aggregatibacter kilianii TaxID=2025884 RepID=UPI0013A64C26|nr:hypothetical protein [Aggregatibacter kilianii]